MRGHVLAVAAAIALGLAVPASGARHAVAHYKIVSATATATFTFTTATSAGDTTDGTARLTVAQKRGGSASVPGAAVAKLTGALTERLRTKSAASPGTPYQETCSNTRKISGRGGLLLRASGGKIEARWAFPQARFSFCRGPSLSKAITAKMKRIYSTRAFGRAHVTLVLSGSGKTHSGSTATTYRWHATVKLSRS